MNQIGIIFDPLQSEAEKTANIIKNSCSIDAGCGFYFVDGEPKKNTQAILVLGGDGFMLHTIRANMVHNIPFYGINYGTIGFLMNSRKKPTEDVTNFIFSRISKARPTKIYPLTMNATTVSGEKRSLIAINEVSIFRKTGQAAHIRVEIDGKMAIDKLMADGILVATPAGSTAYNFSAGGSIIPVGSNLLSLTGINPFRPRRWKSALLNSDVSITLELLETAKRPTNAVADYLEVKNVKLVNIKEDRQREITLLFDEGHSLEERIISEQFKLD